MLRDTRFLRVSVIWFLVFCVVHCVNALQADNGSGCLLPRQQECKTCVLFLQLLMPDPTRPTRFEPRPLPRGHRFLRRFDSDPCLPLLAASHHEIFTYALPPSRPASLVGRDNTSLTALVFRTDILQTIDSRQPEQAIMKPQSGPTVASALWPSPRSEEHSAADLHDPAVS